MELAQTVTNLLILTVMAPLLFWMLNGKFREIERSFDGVNKRFDSVHGDLGGRLDRLEDRIERRFLKVESEIASLRADVTQVALAVGARAPRETGSG